MNLPRRQFLFLATNGVTFLAALSSGWAESFPTRSVRVVVPFAAGGPADVLARLIGQKLTQNLGQQFYVENHPGAGGNLGMAMGARAAPDGYTITVVGTSFVVNPSLYPKIPYDPFKDFAPVTLAATSPNVLVVHPSLPATNVRELIEFLRANPGKYSYAHAGNGTTPQLSGEMFRRSQNLDIVPVAFGGSAPAIQSVLGAHTPIGFTVLTPAVPQVKEGLLRALAVTTPNRSAALPGVPTLAEAGLTDQDADTILGILVPAQTPQEIVSLLHREIARAMKQPDAAEKLAALGFDAIASSPDEFATRIHKDIPKWAKVIRAAQIKSD